MSPSRTVGVLVGSLRRESSHCELRQSLFAVGVPVLPSPEMYIGNVASLLGPDGAVNNEKTRELLTKFMKELEGWIERLLATVPAA